MKKAYIYESLTGVLLLGVVEAYFWTQGRTFAFDSTTTKINLLALYFTLAVVSQTALCWHLRIKLGDALKGNLVVAAILALGLALLGFLVHPGFLKDVPLDWANAVIVIAKLFGSIGMATIVLRILVAAISVRLRGLDVRQG